MRLLHVISFLFVFYLTCQDVSLEVLIQLADKKKQFDQDLKDTADENVKKQLEELEKIGFSAITGVDPDDLKKLADGGFIPSERTVSLRDIFYPFLFELSQLAARPKEIMFEESRLNTIISYQTKLERALVSVREMLSGDLDATLKDFLVQILAKIEQAVSLVKAQRAVAEARLLELQQSKDGLSQLFLRVKSSLLAVLEAILASTLFFLVVKQVKSVFEQHILKSYSSRSLLRRFTLILLVILNFIGSIFTFLYILYLRNEWMIFGLSLLLIAAIGVLSKRLITDFFSQAAILLNLGFVREGEMITYNGIPFRIKSLGFICMLDNPALKNSSVRVPLTDLIDKRSYIVDSEFPWFKTERDSYIFLEGDSVPSRVLEQHIHEIVIERPDKTKLIMPLKDFYNLRIRKIDGEFTVFVRLGIAYKHATHASIITEKLREYVTCHAPEELKILEVEDIDQLSFNAVFLDLGQNSIDYGISAVCKPVHAKYYGAIRRTLVKCFLDYCKTENLEIPFTSITIYRGSSS